MEYKIGRGNAGALRAQPGSMYGDLKTAADWLAALLILIVAAPVMVLAAAAVALTSKGPVIYSQMRLGKNGKAFRIYKFRTMKHRCEAVTGPVWSVANDPRATSIGGFLRSTHIDELPQLWNVLRGEMSLIGPRPERPEIAAKIERVLPTFRQRLTVRPGLSGLSQVLIPPDENIHTVQNKLAHDLEYIRCFGPMLDLRIAISTALCLAGVRPMIASWLVRDFVCYPAIPISPARELEPMTASASSAGDDAPITVQRPMAA
jgi:lipopolysaccharide/colanic/teichoic acid biosynthesis glycosyltransferase